MTTAIAVADFEHTVNTVESAGDLIRENAWTAVTYQLISHIMNHDS